MTRDLSLALHTDTSCGQSQTLGMLYEGKTGVWLHSKECCCTLARALWAPTGAPAWLGHLLQFHMWFSTFPCPGRKFPGWPAQPVVGQGLPVLTILPHSHCPTTPDQFSAPVLVNMSSILYGHSSPSGVGRRNLITGRNSGRED